MFYNRIASVNLKAVQILLTNFPDWMFYSRRGIIFCKMRYYKGPEASLIWLNSVLLFLHARDFFFRDSSQLPIYFYILTFYSLFKILSKITSVYTLQCQYVSTLRHDGAFDNLLLPLPFKLLLQIVEYAYM